ncbi:hypothetical protein [Acinetobacter modestus]|uniref:hypothetical protein n=1 Tax=Acinetobacter modestus TaxID=1776740 RepID=UPI001F4B4B63|nr:hypothetical protein [Acinetobacter modestus]MCH7331283.1 hypothetical protein [Acinetobacter modestus]
MYNEACPYSINATVNCPAFSWRYQDATGKVIVEYWVYIATQKKWVKLKYFSSDSALIPSTEVNLFRTGMNQGWRNGNNLSFYLSEADFTIQGNQQIFTVNGAKFALRIKSKTLTNKNYYRDVSPSFSTNAKIYDLSFELIENPVYALGKSGTTETSVYYTSFNNSPVGDQSTYQTISSFINKHTSPESSFCLDIASNHIGNTIFFNTDKTVTFYDRWKDNKPGAWCSNKPSSLMQTLKYGITTIDGLKSIIIQNPLNYNYDYTSESQFVYIITKTLDGKIAEGRRYDPGYMSGSKDNGGINKVAMLEWAKAVSTDPSILNLPSKQQ